MNTVSQMCSAPLDLISMLEKMPGYENMTDAEMQIMKFMNVQKLDLNQAKPTQPYGTLKRPGGNRGSVMPGAKVNAPDAAKMFREVSLLANKFLHHHWNSQSRLFIRPKRRLLGSEIHGVNKC